MEYNEETNTSVFKNYDKPNEPLIHTTENASSIEMLNYNYVMQHFVYILYLGALSVIGVLGNTIVILVYKFQRKPSTHKTITVSLAVCDVLVCGTVIPFEILEKIYHFSLLTVVTCKLYITLSYCLVFLSAFIILVLSIDRHMRVCYPFKKQLSSKQAIILIFVSFILSLFIVSPNALIWNSREFILTNNLTGHVCVTETSASSSDFPAIYNGLLLVLGGFIVTYVIIVYTCIWRSLIRHIRYVKKFKSGGKRNSDFSLETKPKEEEDHIASCRITTVAFSIVIVLILSYVPSSTMKLLDTRTEQDTQDKDSVNQQILHILARSSVFLNHIANPFIYTFMDPTFRCDCKNFLINLFCSKQEINSENNN